MTVGFGGDKKPAFGRFGADIVFGGCVGKREIAVLELVRGQHPQHIRLVFGPGSGPVKLSTVLSLHNGGIVSGRDGIKTECQPPLQHRLEFDVLVAAHARIGRAPLGVLINKVLDHVLGKSLGEIPDIERDSQHVGNTSGIHRILNGATTSRPSAKSAGHPRESQMHTDDLVAGLHSARGSDSAIHTTAHRCQNFHAHQCRQ